LVVFPVAFWLVWFLHGIEHDAWFSWAIASTVFVIVQRFPLIVRRMYVQSHSYEDFNIKWYLERKLVDESARCIVQQRYEAAFMVVATWVISGSSGLLVYWELFSFQAMPYTGAQIWSLVSGAIAGVNMVQGLILRCILTALIRQQRAQFEKKWRMEGIDLGDPIV
jgi:hypothetical protein